MDYSSTTTGEEVEHITLTSEVIELEKDFLAVVRSHELILNHVDVKIYEGDFTIIMGHLVRENRHCCMHSVVWIGLQMERLHIVEKRLVIITKNRWQSCDQNTLVSYFNKHIWSAI